MVVAARGCASSIARGEIGLARENGACKPGAMITVADLCPEMTRSGRNVTPRAARDWWSKGLLPPPQRRSLGRRKGTETVWTESRIVEQAKTTYDLLALHSRTYTALTGLWLLGFPVDLKRGHRFCAQ